MRGEPSQSTTSQVSQSRQLVAAVLALAVLAVAVRSIALERPLLGNFATKNVVYAMIARNWAEGRASLWYPTLDQLAGGRRSLHMLELPVSACLTGALWRGLGGSLDVWGRATSVAFSTASVLMLFALVRRRHGPGAAIGAATALALSPVSIIYGQSFMLEASLMLFTIATFYALDRYATLDRGGAPRDPSRADTAWAGTVLLAAGAALALALLTKIYMLVLLLPLGWELLRSSRRARVGAGFPVFALALVPAALWYGHAAETASPESPLAAHVFYSVRDSAEVHRPPHPLLRSPDFYRQALDDLSGVVLTPLGFVLALAGLVHPAWRRYVPWLASMGVLVVLLPKKFHEMNYYWMAVLPPLCILVGLGWQVVRRGMRLGRRAGLLLLAVALVLSLRYAARPAFVTPPEDRAVIPAAAAVRALTSPDGPVVTMHGSTIDLLYYCDRPGWAVPPEADDLHARLAEYRARGAEVVAIAGQGPADRTALARLPVLAQGDGWAVHRLAESTP